MTFSYHRFHLFLETFKARAMSYGLGYGAGAHLASLLVLANASKSLAGVFEFAALLTTCSSLWLYLAITTAAILRRQAIVISSLGLAFSLLAMWGAGWEASGLSLLLMLTGLPLYWLRRSRLRTPFHG